MNHVLIVDDEAEIRDSLESILAEEGYIVTTAATAGEALTLIADASYDVVLLDIWLPDRDGLEALADIRQMDSAHLPEVIIISGHGTIEAAVRATKLGAYDFLEKPLSLDRTLLVLRNAMNARRLREDKKRVPFVEGEHLSARIAKPLRRYQAEGRRLASARRAAHQSVAEISNMEIDPERGSTGCCGKEERRTILRHQSGRILSKASPN